MAPSKRKANAIENGNELANKRKLKKDVEKTASSERPNRRSIAAVNSPRSLRSSISNESTSVKQHTGKIITKKSKATPKKPAGQGKAKKTSSSTMIKDPDRDDHAALSGGIEVQVKSVWKPSKGKDNTKDDDNEVSDVPQYWLMKAEPESRIEKGKDVRFSIDDLQNATEPEAWDGMLAHVKFDATKVLILPSIGVRNYGGRSFLQRIKFRLTGCQHVIICAQ